MKVYKLRQGCGNVYAPAKQGDVGYDMSIPFSYSGKIIMPQEKLFVFTGIAIVQDEGYYLRVEPRSSRFLNGILSHGIIDNGYIGEIKIVLWNVSKVPYVLQEGERIVQLIPTLYTLPEISYHDGYPEIETERGENGYGHTDT